MHKKYRDQGFEVLGFPCNQFMNHEPGSNEEIKAFARELYGAEFPMFEKTEVNGPNTCDVYRYIRQNSELYNKKKKQTKEIPWDFTKFLVNSEGQIVSYHNPRIEVKDLEKKI